MKKNSILKTKGPADRSQGSRAQRRAKRRLAEKEAAYQAMLRLPGATSNDFVRPGRGDHW
jgi:hypothetical protein